MISVIIPLYNKEAIIERTLNSVLSQDYEDYEVVIVDDGSTDNSAEIVRSFHDERIRFYSQENGGPSKARNTGVRHAKGDWIVFIDADDEFLPGAFRRFNETAQAHKEYKCIAFPYYNKTRDELLIDDNKIFGTVCNPFKSFYYRDINPRMGSFAITRDIATKCLFDERIRRFEDDEMLFRVFRLTNVYYGMEASMVSNTEFAAASHGRKTIEEDFIGHIDFKGKSFWERMCLYKMFLAERPNYPEQSKAMYPLLNKRYDLLILHKLLNILHK